MRCLVLVMCARSLAFADPKPAVAVKPPPPPTTVGWEKAQPLVLAFKLAGIKPKRDKAKYIWTASSISCSKAPSEDALGDYHCQIDGKILPPAAAYVFQQALITAGVPEDHATSQTQLWANGVTCTLDPTERGADVSYECTYTYRPR